MSAMPVGIGVFLIAAAAVPVEAGGPRQKSPPTTAAVEVTLCAQAQMVVDQLLATAMARMDAARQANAAADLRAAVDSVQGTVRDARAQLAPCASMPPSAGASMDHSKMPMGTAPAKPAPGAKPPAVAPMDHSTMPMPTAPAAKPTSGGKPPGAKPAAPMDHSKMPMGGSADEKIQPTDPVCGLKTNPATAPQATHGGQTYYFCSEQHRELFQKNPTKYQPKGR